MHAAASPGLVKRHGTHQRHGALGQQVSARLPDGVPVLVQKPFGVVQDLSRVVPHSKLERPGQLGPGEGRVVRVESSQLEKPRTLRFRCVRACVGGEWGGVKLNLAW